MNKVAIFQDYLAQMGGAEKVIEAIHQAIPSADICSTLVVPERLSPYLRNLHVKTTWMQKLPAKHRLYRHYFMLYPTAIESAKMDEYDLVISSCCGYAKGVKKAKDAVHVAYCHTLMRWVWNFSEYTERERFSGATKTALSILVRGLKKWEEKVAKRPDYYIANSYIVAGRLKSAFGIDAIVIEPPIETSRFSISSAVDEYYVVLSRLAPYKRIDLAVEACTRTGRRLMVIGGGLDRERLEKMAGPTVKFLGRQTDEMVNYYASHCRALIFPGEEDFGMAPLEVNAAGRPVVAYRAGGATETIKSGLNGVFFDNQTAESLIEAMEECESRDWNSAQIRKYAEKYDITVFQQRLLNFLREVAPNSIL
ncbi:MAG: glycosyltransferase [Terracidiphilus sp.]|nr:glycosyltransferase [Terracidiphilus sp.]